VRAARAAVRALTKRRGANFSLGFRLLPPAKRRAVYAAYAACRVPDDIVDESEGDAAGAPEGARLDSWAAEIEATYAGHPGTSVTYALAEVSLAIFGLVREEGRALGRHLALALQLTNICRDVREDLGRGRVYLPADEMAEFGVSVHDLEGGRVDTPAYRALMTFQCRRARTHFAAANPLPDCLAGDSRAAVRVMGGVYRRILDRVARDPVAAFHRRVELPPWQRWWAVASGLCGQPFVPL